ncbi:MAG: hypothetical protein LLF94_07745 [Chlamydiales bacterium]|nr:hypothetical protein [Chlamydiales bacterium]
MITSCLRCIAGATSLLLAIMLPAPGFAKHHSSHDSSHEKSHKKSGYPASKKCSDPLNFGEFRAAYQNFRVVDNERQRVPGGDGRLLSIGIWYPVEPKKVHNNTPPAGYGDSWLKPGDFIPDGILDDIAAGNLTAIPPLYLSTNAVDGSNLPLPHHEKFPLIIMPPSATIPVWTIFEQFAETAASHGFVVVSIDPLIGDGWRTGQLFGPPADSSGTILYNRTEDIQYMIDLLTYPERWTENNLPDPATQSPNHLYRIVELRKIIDSNSVGITTASAGGGPMFEYALRGDPRIKALVPLHSAASTLTQAELAQVRIPLLIESGSLDTNFPPAVVEATYDGIGTCPKDKFWVEVLGASHFDGITCAAADGFFRAQVPYTVSTFAINRANGLAGAFDGLCLNQVDISSQQVSDVFVRGAISMFKVYLSKDKCYDKYLLSCNGAHVKLKASTDHSIRCSEADIEDPVVDNRLKSRAKKCNNHFNGHLK